MRVLHLEPRTNLPVVRIRRVSMLSHYALQVPGGRLPGTDLCHFAPGDRRAASVSL